MGTTDMFVFWPIRLFYSGDLEPVVFYMKAEKTRRAMYTSMGLCLQKEEGQCSWRFRIIICTYATN